MVRKFKRGDRFHTVSGNVLSVMACEDKYVMARYKGCMPICETEHDFTNRVSDMVPDPKNHKPINLPRHWALYKEKDEN